MVLASMNSLKEHLHEKKRFQHVVKAFKNAKLLELKAKYLAFINELINETSDVDLRISLRNEFTALGLQKMLKVFLIFVAFNNFNRNVKSMKNSPLV